MGHEGGVMGQASISEGSYGTGINQRELHRGGVMGQAQLTKTTQLHYGSPIGKAADLNSLSKEVMDDPPPLNTRLRR